MSPDRLQDYLAALRQAPNETAQSRILETARHHILRIPDAAADLIRLMGTEDPDSKANETLFMLLEVALETARMARENGQPDGARFLTDFDKHLGDRATARDLRTADRLALGRAYVQADLPPSQHLVMDVEDFDAFADPAPEMPDLDALLDNLRDEAGAEPMAIHMALSEMMATLPYPVRAMIVDQIARRPDALYARAGTYWLLDADATLRRAAAEGFLHRTQSGQMDAATIGRLITMRSWLPADGARDVLDRLIKEAMRRDVAGGAVPKTWKVHRILASIPDGAGAQSIAVAAQSGGQRAIAMLLLKQGFGVKDAYLIPCASASEQKRFLASISEEIAVDEVTVEFVRNALAIALGDGLEAVLLPAPGLVDVAEVCGLHDLRPSAHSVQDMLGTVAPDGDLAEISPQRLNRLVGRSVDWPDRFEVLESWFEDNGEVRDSLAAATTPRAREQRMWRYLETQRGWWARMFARTALTLHAADDLSWIEFAATAIALEKGRELKKTPIMQYIAQHSLANPDAPGNLSFVSDDDDPDIDYLDVPKFVAPEKKGELARLLKASSITPDWINGFLMAIVVSPKMIPPQRWLEPLFDVLRDLPNEEGLQRFLDIIMLRYNAANETAQDPAALKAALKGLSAQGWADWAAGFATVPKEFKSSWPARALNVDDKAVLRQIGEAANSAKETGSLGALLPTWLARRFELRS